MSSKETVRCRLQGKVYVELSAPGGAGIGKYERAAPKDSTALFYLFYLSPAPPASDFPVVDPEAGRPAGFPHRRRPERQADPPWRPDL